MTGKERFYTALAGKPTDCTPTAILDGYVWMLKREQISFADLMNQSDFGAAMVCKTYNDFGVDNICTNAHTGNLFMKYMGGSVCYDRVGQAFEITKPPLAEIEEIRNFSVDAIMEQAKADPEFMSAMHLTAKMREYYGDTRSIWANTWAPYTFAGMMVGVQNFMEQMLDDEENTQLLVDFATELIIRYCDMLVDYGADAVMICDPVSSVLIKKKRRNPKLFVL